jgi:hypothetical protein
MLVGILFSREIPASLLRFRATFPGWRANWLQELDKLSVRPFARFVSASTRASQARAPKRPNIPGLDQERLPKSYHFSKLRYDTYGDTGSFVYSAMSFWTRENKGDPR